MKVSRTAALTGCAISASLMLGAMYATTPRAYGAQETCSVAKLQGSYVFTGQGKNLHSGAFDFDGGGSFSGKQTSIRPTSTSQREVLHGTYSLGPDCTGTVTMDGQLGGTGHWMFL